MKFKIVTKDFTTDKLNSCIAAMMHRGHFWKYKGHPYYLREERVPLALTNVNTAGYKGIFTSTDIPDCKVFSYEELMNWAYGKDSPFEEKKWTHTSYAGRCKIVCEHKGVVLIEQENGDVWSADKSAVKPIETIPVTKAWFLVRSGKMTFQEVEDKYNVIA